MKKLIFLLASFVLSSGVVMATPSSGDCGDDDVQPITVSMAETSWTNSL